MMIPLTVGFIAIARPTFDVELAQQMTDQALEALRAANFQVVGDRRLVMDADLARSASAQLQQQTQDALVLFQASFADSSMAIQLTQEIGVPVILWGIPEARTGGRLRLNSFCGINLTAHGLKRRQMIYDTIYAAPDDPQAMHRIQVVARAGQVKRRLQTANIGRIGENPAGFDTCLVNHEGLAQRFGVTVTQLELNSVFERMRAGSPESRAQVASLRAELSQQVAGLDAVDATATDGTLTAYTVLNEAAQRQQLDGLAVRCWPEFFTEMQCAACGAMSMLSDRLTPCSCEADVNGTITQLILQWISGEAAFGSDLVAFDTDEDVAVLWHCGLAPLSMADPDVQPSAALHSNRQLPLLMQFPLKPGRVTLARLSEATGDFRLVISTGEMLRRPPSFTGTTGTLRFDSGTQAAMETLLSEGLEHHVSLTYGDHADTLEALARLLGLPVLRL